MIRPESSKVNHRHRGFVRTVPHAALRPAPAAMKTEHEPDLSPVNRRGRTSLIAPTCCRRKLFSRQKPKVPYETGSAHILGKAVVAIGQSPKAEEGPFSFNRSCDRQGVTSAQCKVNRISVSEFC